MCAAGTCRLPHKGSPPEIDPFSRQTWFLLSYRSSPHHQPLLARNSATHPVVTEIQHAQRSKVGHVSALNARDVAARQACSCHCLGQLSITRIEQQEACREARELVEVVAVSRREQ
jgi:hypothetical protein